MAGQSVHRGRVKAVAGVWWGGWLGSYCIGRVVNALEPAVGGTAEELLSYFDRAVTGELVGRASSPCPGPA
ncbi:hypothetical protein [Catellatospora chokoriensis]|uniref:hypothetical protein n=1 Tax=Catellatospora chokoriensis TaxID=310353 RepID=UPI00177F9C90|nr:hypothetical protein [Catellatospora chokoriensis]